MLLIYACSISIIGDSIIGLLWLTDSTAFSAFQLHENVSQSRTAVDRWRR